IGLLIIAWYTIPSFQVKLGYSYWEMMELIGQSEQATTLSARIQSYFCGWQVFLDHPLFGTGVGDLKEKMAKCWVMNYGYGAMYMPHNQYLSWLAGNGLIFTLAMLGVCFLPLFGMRKESVPLVWSVILALMVSFLVENTIENSFGVAIHSFFSLWFLRFHSKST
ncbi:MAG TPA: O-antigen ligase family protein, partial [Saprospiraceae bacterium]|nr:O-antigen ligase family protein [Saprospiraceae bacterium]